MAMTCVIVVTGAVTSGMLSASVLGVITIALGVVMPGMLVFCVLCVVVISLGVVMPGVVVSGVLGMIVITFGMFLVFSANVFVMPVPIICGMALVGWRCGR